MTLVLKNNWTEKSGNILWERLKRSPLISEYNYILDSTATVSSRDFLFYGNSLWINLLYYFNSVLLEVWLTTLTTVQLLLDLYYFCGGGGILVAIQICILFRHSYKTRKDSSETRAVLLILSLELEMPKVAVQKIN